MKVTVDNDKREIYINGVKSTVTWDLLDHTRLLNEYGINVHAEESQRIRFHLHHEFRLGRGHRRLLDWIIAIKLKLKWDNEP